MRLTCDIDIASRLLPTQGMVGKSKGVRASLSIGKRTGTDSKEAAIYLLVCTAKEKTGIKYRLKENIEQFFAKFIGEGKATVRLKEPQLDIRLSKANPVDLKNFLGALRLASRNADIEKLQLTPLTRATSSQVEKPQTRMTVLKRKDYPLTKSFPRSLEALKVSNCSLTRIDFRILDLKKLKVLDLSENHIRSLPTSMEHLVSLSELNLSHNQLSVFPPELCKEPLKSTLHLLDLSHNKFKVIPPHITALTKLVHFKLERNEIMRLPQAIGRLQQLRFFSAGHNQIKTLPAGFIRLRLDSLDLFGNPFLDDGPSTATSRLKFPTLLEIAARMVRKLGLSYDENEIPKPLCDYLDSMKKCLCGSPCFESCVHFLARVNLHRLAHTVTSLDHTGRTNAPLEAYLCSQRCHNRYQNNPNAIWR
ncbi:leucine-rich repeat protein 1-like [Saccoglossus kowalevskii]|uniref:Leucine-rich repeat protein 1-like isoform X1 n=1 Tax=Saccoglossus kowalevskii TaxID=10224 RepID=A0ABM0MZ27_SACKO|nr:PREDICTED: leucine-rich repeat protein 1-like isoform X1 [Saccoglossus kowalevskii]XP_006825268.1 PREDICTED: leucine-rich repeat protein 1-like isoform X2 [Saccoglossus kowalevskii]